MSTSALAADPIEAKAKLCAACHGEDGIPQLKTTPVIWGQNAGYMFLQLRDFQIGARKNDLMSPIAADARQGGPAPARHLFLAAQMAQSAAAGGACRRRRQGAVRGRLGGLHRLPSRSLPGRRHHGPPRRPAADYLQKTMMDFRTKARGNNPGMSDLMKATTPDDHRRARAISRRDADRPISLRPGPLTLYCVAASFSRSAVSVVKIGCALALLVAQSFYRRRAPAADRPRPCG